MHLTREEHRPRVTRGPPSLSLRSGHPARCDGMPTVPLLSVLAPIILPPYEKGGVGAERQSAVSIWLDVWSRTMSEHVCSSPKQGSDFTNTHTRIDPAFRHMLQADCLIVNAAKYLSKVISSMIFIKRQRTAAGITLLIEYGRKADGVCSNIASIFNSTTLTGRCYTSYYINFCI